MPGIKTLSRNWGFALFTFASIFLTACDGQQKKIHQAQELKPFNEGTGSDMDTIYKTENLILVKLSSQVYQHISFLNTSDFGKVPGNGMVVVNNHQAIIFDTPADDKSSEELINFILHNLESKIQAVIPTHFHEDCVGGLKEFNKHQIPTFASNKTIQVLTTKGKEFAGFMQGFEDSLFLNLGNKKVEIKYFGEGHSNDNIVGYFPSDSILFGGCLVKELSAGKGNLADANTNTWSATVVKLKQHYPMAKVVIPGHGKSGGQDLLDYTIALFK